MSSTYAPLFTRMISLTLGSLLVAGCSAKDAKETLLQAMQPIQCSPYVQLVGRDQSATGEGKRESFILLLGPDGRYLYRSGNTCIYCDGKRRGMIDFTVIPPREEVFSDGGDCAESLAIAIGMARGPYAFAAARTVTDNSWLSTLVDGPPTYLFQERAARTEITIRSRSGEHGFTFDSATLAPLAYRFAPTGSNAELAFSFSAVEYPTSMPAVAFSMQAQSQRPVNVSSDGLK